MLSNRIQSVNFLAHTSEEIKKLAVKQITNPETYDEFLHPNFFGLYDPALGSNEVSEVCETCGMNNLKCPGHVGYIKLPLTIYHPLFFKLMVQVLKGSCFKCHRLLVKSSVGNCFIRQCELLEMGYLTEANDLGELYYSFVSDCADAAATNIHMEDLITAEVDKYFENVKSGCSCEDEVKSTRNIVHSKQQLVKRFMNDFVKVKQKKCPHCESIVRDIRSEYNSRIYFKSVGIRALNKALTEKSTRNERRNNENDDELDDSLLRLEQDNDLLDDENDDENNDDEDDEDLKERLSKQEFITPEEVKNHIIKLFNFNMKLFQCLFGSYVGKNKFATPEIFFLDVLAVPPSRYRPQAFLGEKRFENPQTANLSKILWDCKLVEEIMMCMNKDETNFTPVKLSKVSSRKKMGGGVVTVAGNSYKEQLQNAWLELQGDVNTFMDSSLNKLANEPLPGVRQLLEKKEGLFRKNMMGKRVDYACRSVISPDPFINTDEIGVPEVFASKLTYAQPVTPWNHKKLAQMVINGPNKYPGAVMIEYEDGRKVMLPDKLKEREAIAKQLSSSSVGIESAKEKEKASLDKKVYRHLLNGDVLLLNRQPTLHRPSIMAHKAKVLPNERTLRLHYANCKSYNADFDGDEMNAHFPQNELGRSEAYNIVSTNMNYLSPKDGKPLAGLIQDHIVSGVMMTARDRFFDREEYQQLVYSAFLDTPGRIKMLKPCIIKPLPKWSGKQVVSTIIINVVPKGKRLLNMTGGRARIADHSWPYLKKKSKESISSSHVNDPALTESQVIIREGELMTGILDKTQYGAASYGIVHSMYELYGGKTSGLLLSVFARLFTAFLQYTGFTLGIEDLLVVPHAESKRVEILQEAKHCGDESAMDALKLNKKKKLGERLKEAHHMNSGFELKLLDAAMKTRTDNVNNKVNTACMRGLRKKFPCNALQLMVQSGAKGSSVNAMQISCLLGQIELEGRRPPLSASGRSLPSFRPYDTSPRAGGFVDGRFLTGIRPQEYFFHCMAGREGLVDTAVKTSSSGYLQRCLIKHMEALYVQYDMTVRDGDGSVIQFLYGDDGIDVLNNQYLEDKQFKSILSNHQNYVEMLRPTNVSSTVDIEKAVKCQKKCDRWKRKHSEVYSSPWFHNRKSPFHLFEEGNRRKARKKHPNPTKKLAFSEADRYLFKKWGSSDGPTKDSIVRKCMPCPDPVLSRFNPACYFGAVSEKFHDDVRLFIDSESSFSETSTSQNNSMSRENFKPLMLIKFMRSLVEPGEAVGLLASQSIGEPSTQMTLNTFHFAGRGDMNVTLGIPRLREILMTASKSIKTPQMDVLVLPGKEEEARLISKKLNKLSLYKVLKNISVDEMLSKSLHDATTRCREFRVKLEFLPEYAYKDTYPTTPSAIIKFVETVFLKKIAKAVEKVILVKNKQKFMSMEKKRVNNTDETNEDESERVDEPMDEPDDLADLSDEEIEGDGDASNTKEKARKTQFTSYEQDDSYDDDANEADTSLAPDETTLLPTIKTEHEDIDYNQYDDGDDVNVKMEEEFQPTDEDIRIQNVLRRDRHIVAYLVDVDNLWCEVTFQFPRSGSKLMLIPLIEKLAEKAIIQESHGISRAMVVESKLPSENGRFRLKTEGININELWCHPNVLDVNSVYTNDIHIFSNTYGIEAARRVLIKEVEDVFKVYGIHINPRHLSLVGDYMTFEGAYKPFNRIGIETSAFPFQKMSFETSTHFLRHATAFGEPDSLGSPSSRIVVGRVIGTGTGMCDLLPDLSI